MDKGYKKVRPLVGGLDAWIEAGRAVETEALADGVTPSPIGPRTD